MDLLLEVFLNRNRGKSPPHSAHARLEDINNRGFVNPLASTETLEMFTARSQQTGPFNISEKTRLLDDEDEEEV